VAYIYLAYTGQAEIADFGSKIKRTARNPADLAAQELGPL